MGRSILLTGACGSGRVTVLSVGQTTMARHLGRTAMVDTDDVLKMVGAWHRHDL